jgi:hypothetical protein
MNRKIFTPDELLKIRQSPYVKSATSNSIRFTVDFKEKFWEQYEKGISPANIVQSMGFDPDVLGSSRILGIVRHIKEQLQTEKGLRDVYQRSLTDEVPGKLLPPSKTLLHMQHQINYMKQELEFIKKMILADREAERKCSSSQNRKSSSELSGK